jgi:hypothetical protein
MKQYSFDPLDGTEETKDLKLSPTYDAVDEQEEERMLDWKSPSGE